ncbi:SRPBCC domain-containing protein [Chitinophaga sp. Cy-1792]|uniref:SRPBCC family protein n=1 Tax=Chitinophaga sp. Cy-1792 TaxID=2608339 RepID=UPI0014217A51|nr:SRPBCC domain-containing protein [Chitinophaga sp. Cy-1792]NIG55680.1 SRPBCC domain-containing protein [Chitinophaga sp. Cy-1792]
MNPNLAFDFTVDKAQKMITIQREFAAAVPLVWNAYTKSDMLDQWWGPKPWKARTKSMDFREGGRWLYAMVSPQGEEHWSIADYSSIKPEQSYAAWYAFTDAEGNVNAELPASDWVVHFSPKGDHTLVEIVITYAELAHLETIIKMQFKEGLAMGMNQLDQLLAEKQNG